MASTSSPSGSPAQRPTTLDRDMLARSNIEPRRSSGGCRWRTRQYYAQECSRYFDCPTHTIERRLSIDEDHDIPPSAEARPTDPASSEPQNAGAGGERHSVLSDELESLRIAAGAGEPESSTEPPSTSTVAGSSAPQGEDMEVRQIETLQEEGLPTDQTAVEEQNRDHDILSDLPLSPEMRLPVRAHSATVPRHGAELLAQAPPPPSPPSPRPVRHQDSPDITMPRWQPDAEATYCPICYTQFSIFVRKHHCRKCGRVVCNSCSPHRIIIPHQYIVRPPGTEAPTPQNLLVDNLGLGYFDVNGLSGGERVRLCNPCVPDPNIAPPQSSSTASSPAPAGLPSYGGAHQRTRSSIGDAYGASIPPNNRYGVVFPLSQSHEAPSRAAYAGRSRSTTMHPTHRGHESSGSSSSRNRGSTGSYYASLDPFAGGSSSRYAHRYSTHREPGSSSRQRNLPPTPQIAEEDECPICHRELPSRSLANFESLRESHITTCIQTHSSYGSPRRGSGNTGGESPQAAPRRTGMYTYSATEKDCIDDAECTICLEEFTVGVAMARLECLCRFHRSCIAAWFVNHPGRCPVHQHDGFGY